LTPADLARKWINREQTPEDGIPSWLLVVMDVGWTERLLGEPEGSYFTDPVGFELRQKRVLRTAFLDQLVCVPQHQVASGFGGRMPHGSFERDGIRIDGPEGVKEHYERFLIPALERSVADFPANASAIREQFLAGIRQTQDVLGPDCLRVPYEHTQCKPVFRYGEYGYESWFMFYATYPELAGEAFRLEADYAMLQNGLLAQAIVDEGLPRLVRSDHDMTDSRGSLVSVASLDRLYFPELERAMGPLIDRGIGLIWHCDGNVNDFIPRLLDIGFVGFQGFQYECGVHYPAVARMTTRKGEPLTLIVGGSVTTTMVHGTPDDVRREMDWLVENSGDSYLALGGTSSICPGTPWGNIDALLESMLHYQEHGKAGLRQRVGCERPFGRRPT